MRSPKKNRTFPRLYLWLAICTIGGCVVMFGAGVTYFAVASYGWSRGEYQQADSIECNQLATRFGIEVVTPAGDVSISYGFETIRASNADQDQIDRFGPTLAEEFSIYPTDLVQKTKLRRLVLCTNLTLRSEPVAALPEFQRNLLFLDAGALAKDMRYARRAIHHEFFHIIDCRDDSKLYSDPEWQALNTPNFRYGNGGWSARDPESGILTEKYPGFLNHYSTTGVEEDKAEIYSHMIKEPEYVKSRALKDPVLQAKVSRMKILVKNFSPAMDEEFWDRVENMNRRVP